MDPLKTNNECDATPSASKQDSAVARTSIPEYLTIPGSKTNQTKDCPSVLTDANPVVDTLSIPVGGGLSNLEVSDAVVASEESSQNPTSLPKLSLDGVVGDFVTPITGRVVGNPESVDSESDSDNTLNLDSASTYSDKSGFTQVGNELRQLSLKPGSGFVRLNAPQKRRFKKALASGLSREDALSEATSPSSGRTESKRGRSEEQSPVCPKPKKLKTAQAVTTKHTTQGSGFVKLGFVPVNRESCPLLSEQMVRLQDEIIRATIDYPSSSVKPEFEGWVPRTGWAFAICSNEQTANWLKANFDRIKSKCALDISIVEEGNFPRTHVIRGYFPQSLALSNDSILASVEAQNPLSVGQWKVVQRLDSGPLVHLVMVIDDVSMAKLTELNGRIAYRFGHIKLILKGFVPKNQLEKITQQKGEEAVTATPSTPPPLDLSKSGESVVDLSGAPTACESQNTEPAAEQAKCGDKQATEPLLTKKSQKAPGASRASKGPYALVGPTTSRAAGLTGRGASRGGVRAKADTQTKGKSAAERRNPVTVSTTSTQRTGPGMFKATKGERGKGPRRGKADFLVKRSLEGP